jgi:hypothetical protein
LSEGTKKDALEAVLDNSIGHLDEHSQPEAVELALNKLQNEAKRLNVVQQGLLQDGAKKRLKGIASAATVDTAFAAIRKNQGAEDNVFGWVDPRPSAEPVDGAELLNEISAKVAKHIVLPEGAADAITLWIVNTYTFDLFEVSPYLALNSPLKRCGKTRTFKFIGALANRPLPASNTSNAVIYRVIEEHKPTLLMDEAETYVFKSEEIRGILNSGHTRNAAWVLRCAGADFEPARFSTWCPKAFAMIGQLPSTLEDRSIVIPMRRKGKEEVIEAIPQGRLEAWASEISSQIVRWVQEHEAELREAAPKRHSALHDRANDNWSPLFAIADLAGGKWPERARASAVALQTTSGSEGYDNTTQLLEDIRGILSEARFERVSSEALAMRLGEMEDRPWAEWKGGRPITAAQLAQLLKPFKVGPKKMRISSYKEPVRGYETAWFEPIFSAYLPPKVEQAEHPEHPSESSNLEPLVCYADDGTEIGTLACAPIPVDVPDVPGVPEVGER